MILDGGKGLRTAPEGLPEPFLVHRCQWHKRVGRGEPSGRTSRRRRPASPARLHRPHSNEAQMRSRRSSASWTSGTSRRPAPRGRPGRDPDIASTWGVRGAGPVVQDDEPVWSLSMRWSRNGARRSILADLEPTPPPGDGAPRTTSERWASPGSLPELRRRRKPSGAGWASPRSHQPLPQQEREMPIILRYCGLRPRGPSRHAAPVARSSRRTSGRSAALVLDGDRGVRAGDRARPVSRP